jgi:hypothetical protein
MLKKMLITLKYGEKKAKILIVTIMILVLGGLGLLAFGILKSYIIPLGAGALLMIIGLLLLFSFSFVDIDVNMEKEAENRRSKKKKGEDPDEETVKKEEPKQEKPVENEDPDIDFSMFAEDLSDIAIGVGGMPMPGANASGDKKGSEEDGEAETSEEDVRDEKKGKKKKEKKEKQEDGVSDDEINAILGDYGEDDEEDDDEDGKRVKVNGSKDFEVKKPTPKQIKARKKMLKVRKDDRRFTPIIVDVWKAVSALRTPAFVQDKGKTANIVLVEGALRTELMPMSDFLEVTYQKNVEENFMEQYEEIRKDPDVSPIFEELIPAFYQGNVRGGSSENFCKNLYVLGGKMAITPRSLRKLFNKFDFHFKVFDSLDLKGNYSDYFKAAYENRIFWTDNVITQNDYQERTRSILQSMVEDTKLLNVDFERDLQLMVRYNLITKEYADYYMSRKRDGIKLHI